MNDHDSMPIGSDDRPRMVLLRLLAGGMSILLFSVAGYIYVSVPPEWSFDYITSMALSLGNGALLLIIAAHTPDTTHPRVPPPVTRPGKPVKPIVRALAGITGSIFLVFFLWMSLHDWQQGASDRFSSLVMSLLIPGLLLWIAINGREMNWRDFGERFGSLFFIGMGFGWTLDGLFANKPTDLGLGLPLLCLFLYFALWERLARPVPDSRE